jgi:uncharacterized oxidoreductase
MGAPPDVAAETARHLVGANLAGHDSHGVLRLAQYAAQVEGGLLEASARGEIVRANDVLCIYDGARGFGQWACRQALEWCLEHAAGSGIAAAAVRRSMHAGRLGDYVERAAEAGFAAIVTLGIAGPGAGLVAPFGGTRRYLGTNPWAMGMPVADGNPFLMDFATSNVAEGKVRVARAKGAQLPAGVLIDAAGRPTTDPARLYEAGSLTVLGGDVAGHKGYGLSLAAALFGALAMIDDEEPTPAGTMSGMPPETPWLAGVFMVVLDPEWFGGRERFAEQVRGVTDAVRREGALLPGDPEVTTRAERLRRGIALPGPTWEELNLVSESLGVEMIGADSPG